MLMAESVTPDKEQICPLIREAAPRQHTTKFQSVD